MDLNLVKRAYSFAKKKHKGQLRDNGEEYIIHPINVAKIIIEYKYCEDIDILVASALLHDTIEDTYTSIKELVEKFGEVIASLVIELTSAKVASRLEGKDVYLSKKMQNMTNYALAIKLADRLDNVRHLDGSPQEKKERYLIQTKKILDYVVRNRELTSTQQKLADEIYKTMESYK